MLTAQDFLNQMIAQVRLLDSSFSGEIGTPEYKLLSGVATSLANNQVDMTGLANALNIDSKVGSNLDQFMSLLGVQRQSSTPGTGYVVFYCPSGQNAPLNITVPQGIVLQANGVNVNSPTTIQYYTSAAGTIAQGENASAPVPVQAITSGIATNIPAGALNQIVGTIPTGVASVSNPNVINNGIDPEDDDVFKSRFQNTWARNLSGNTSSYLAVALAGAFTTKANCIGQQSTYTEYIQVPYFDDAGYFNGSPSEYTSGNLSGYSANTGGVQTQWTTALSDIPYAKQIFTSTPVFISDSAGVGNYYFQEGVDFNFNSPAVISGDAVREISTLSSGGTQTLNSSPSTFTVANTLAFPEVGTLWLEVSSTWHQIEYTSWNASPSEFGGCVVVGGSSISVINNTPVYFYPNGPTPGQYYANQPNFTFLNVYQGESDEIDALNPGDVILSEYRYVSQASRNDIDLNINNCIDVFVNNSNPQQCNMVFIPSASLPTFSVGSSANPYDIENYRRDGEPTTRPLPGSYFTPLFNPPILSIPTSLQIVGSDSVTNNYFLGTHYWLVHETGQLENSIRARDGIEWSAYLVGDLTNVPPTNPLAPYLPGGNLNISQAGTEQVPVYVSNYTNDANIIGMQATYDLSGPTTTDVLAHGNRVRYFKCYVAIQYTPNTSASVVNAAIQAALSAYFNNQYFGTLVQISSVLDVIASTPGVQNVRWYNDTPNSVINYRIVETDINSNPLQGLTVERYRQLSTGHDSVYITVYGTNFGPDDSCTFTYNDLTWGLTNVSMNLIYNDITAPYILEQYEDTFSSTPGGTPYFGTPTVYLIYDNTNTQEGSINPCKIYQLVYPAAGHTYLPTIVNNVTQGTYLYEEDFFLQDDELPALPTTALATDTVAGLIAVTRAENTFYRP